MAFTEENKQDAYFVFTSMFQAAPGKVFAAEIVAAYNAGMTTAQIVAEYATKAPFLKLYPATQSNADFAAAFVKNVLGNTVTDAVKAKAAKEIETALNGGMPKAEVIFNSLSNLSKKTVADAEYGKAAQMLINKIQVAKELTEGAKALNTTDVDLLQNPLKNVTEDVATVQAAINGSSDLVTKLNNLTAAKKALTDFVANNKLGDAVKDVAAAKAALAAKEATASEAIKAFPAAGVAGTGLSKDAGVKAAEIQTAKATAELNVKNAQKSVSDFEAALAKVKSTDGKTNLLDAVKTKAAADQALTSSSNALKAAATGVDKALADAVAAGSKAVLNATALSKYADPSATATGTKPAATAMDDLIVTIDSVSVISFNATTKVYEFATTATAAQKTELAGVLNSLNNAYTAAVSTDSVEDTALNAKLVEVAASGTPADVANEFKVADLAGAFSGLSFVDAVGGSIAAPTTVSTAAATDVSTVYTAVTTGAKTALENQTKLAAHIATVDANTVLVAELTTIENNLTAVQKSFTDAGYKLPVEVEGALFASTDADIFLVTAKSAEASIFGFAGKDSLFVGSNYSLGADVAKGDDAKLEVFFKTNGVNTDVYVEQKAFGSSSAATTKDIVKVTLTGVTADKVKLTAEGFITLA